MRGQVFVTPHLLLYNYSKLDSELVDPGIVKHWNRKNKKFDWTAGTEQMMKRKTVGMNIWVKQKKGKVPHDIVVELGCINQIFTGFEV
jgi:hypothetical protein